MRYRKKLFLMVTTLLTILLLSSILVQAKTDLGGGAKGGLDGGVAAPAVTPATSPSSSSSISSGGSSQPASNPTEKLKITVKSLFEDRVLEDCDVAIFVFSGGDSPVKNAKVRWNGHTSYTDDEGKVTVRTSKVNKKTTYPITASCSGYLDGRVTLTVCNIKQTRSDQSDVENAIEMGALFY